MFQGAAPSSRFELRTIWLPTAVGLQTTCVVVRVRVVEVVVAPTVVVWAGSVMVVAVKPSHEQADA